MNRCWLVVSDSLKDVEWVWNGVEVIAVVVGSGWRGGGEDSWPGNVWCCSEVNWERASLAGLRVVKMPSTGLCRITFAGTSRQSDAIILLRSLFYSSSSRQAGKNG